MAPAEPLFDTLVVANDLRRRHGAAAVDLASRRAKEHLQKASWMAGGKFFRQARNVSQNSLFVRSWAGSGSQSNGGRRGCPV